MFLTQKTEFSKQYIPGYKGHVPNKKNLPPPVFIVESDRPVNHSLPRKQVDKTGGRHPGACSNLGKKLFKF